MVPLLLIIYVPSSNFNFFFFQTTFPEITFTKDDPEIMVTKGGGVVFNLDIYIPYDSILNYGITFQSDIEDTYR